MMKFLILSILVAAVTFTGCQQNKRDAEEFAFRAEVFIALNKLDRAEQEATKATQANPADPEAWFQLAEVMARRNNADSAIALYAKSAEVDAKFVKGLLALSNAYVATQKLDNALKAIRRVIEVKPDTSVAYNNEGVILTNLARFDEAVAAFTKAIEKDPSNAQAHYNLGNVLMKQGKHDLAVPSYKKALELNPNFAQAYVDLAAISNAKGDVHEAYNNQGLALLVQNNIAGAVELFKKAVEAKPDYAIGHNNLGHAYLRMNDRARGVEGLKAAAKLGYADAQRLLRQENITW